MIEICAHSRTIILGLKSGLSLCCYFFSILHTLMAYRLLFLHIFLLYPEDKNLPQVPDSDSDEGSKDEAEVIEGVYTVKSLKRKLKEMIVANGSRMRH